MPTNGSYVQQNFNFLGSQGGAFEFINVFNSVGQWGNALTPDKLDDDNWPKDISVSGSVTVFPAIPTQTQRPGNYYLVTDGVGTMNCNGISGSFTNTTDGQKRLLGAIGGTGTGGFNITFTISSTGSPANSGINYLRNIRIYHEDDEADLLAGKTFRQGFKDILAPFGVHRMLNWQNTNFSPDKFWSERKTMSFYSYAASKLVPTKWAGTTTSSSTANTLDFDISFVGWTWTDGNFIHLKFDVGSNSSNSFTNTLTINGTKKNILLLNGLPLPPRAQFGGFAFSAGRISTIKYDLALDAFLVFSTTNGQAPSGTTVGMPIEAMVEICNDTGADIYICVPPLTVDTPDYLPNYLDLDYMTQLITYVRDNLRTGLTAWYETAPNECWNSIFFGTWYGEARENQRTGHTLPPGSSLDIDSTYQWCGQASTLVGRLLEDLYGELAGSGRFGAIIGFQAARGTTGNLLNKLNSSAYVSRSGSATNAAYNWNSHICTAGYWSFGSLPANFLSYAYEYQLPATTDARKLDILFALSINGPSGLRNSLAQFQALATSYNKRFCLYEGGLDIQTTGSNVSATITNVTLGSITVITVSGLNQFQNGMTTTISSVVGTTELNGNTYTVLSVAGQTVTLNVDSSGFTPYVSGGSALYVGSATWQTNLFYAWKYAFPTASPIRYYTLTGYYEMFASLGGNIDFASEFDFSGNATNHEWSMWPNVFGETPPRPIAAQQFADEQNYQPQPYHGVNVPPYLNPITTTTLRHRNFPVPVGYPKARNTLASPYGHRATQRLGSTFTSGNPGAHRIGAGTRPPPPRRRK
jgi:hypothetical protein